MQAVAGLMLLTRRRIDSTIRFGVRQRDGKLEAHAWLLVGGETVIGGQPAGDYTPLADMTAGVQNTRTSNG